MAIGDGEDILASDILGLVSFETTAGTTHSLTTVANEKVLVIAKGSTTGGTVTLSYNGVQKDSVTTTANRSAWCLMYTETPGAATANIIIGGSDSEYVIIGIKLKQS